MHGDRSLNKRTGPLEFVANEVGGAGFHRGLLVLLPGFRRWG